MKISNTIQTLILLSLSGIFTISCTTTNDVVAPGDKPVIQAYLAPGQRISMTVFTEIPYSGSDADSTETPILGLAIRVSDNTGKVFVLADQGNGTYLSAATEKVGAAGTVYTLEFGYNGRVVKGSTTIPAKPENFTLSRTFLLRTKIDLSGGGFPGGGGGGPFGGNVEDNTPIEATWNNPNNENFFLAAELTTPNADPIITLPAGRELPGRRFVNEPVTNASSNLNIQSFEYFGTYNVILYRVGVEYVALYQSSGTTTQNLSTPPSNISNGLGIFTGVNADTVALQIVPQ